LDITIQDNRRTLGAIYAPNEDNPNFFEKISQILELIDNETIVVAGDWNVVRDYHLDTKNYKQSNNPLANKKLSELLDILNLNDIWRIKHPNKRTFTWHGPHKKMSRLDYFVISSNLLNNCIKTNILPGYRSDHSVITADLLLKEQPRGKGTSLLKDQKCVTIIRYKIKDVHFNHSKNKEIFFDPSSTALNTSDIIFFETLKIIIRGTTIEYSSRKKKLLQSDESELSAKISNLNEIYEKNATDTNYRNLLDSQNNLKQLRDTKIKGAIIRTKSKWHNEAEHCSKFVCHLEKQNFIGKTIYKLELENRKIIENVEEILAEQACFYEKLYKSKISGNLDGVDTSNLFHNKDNPFYKNFITQNDAEKIEAEITFEDVEEALYDLKNDKSPGFDGYTAEFSKKFWPELDLFRFDLLENLLPYGKCQVHKNKA